MASLDVLLLKGPSQGNLEEGLNELRYAILTQGIPANSEGMVSCSCLPHHVMCF
jgi:cell cycle arrest protein BUB2